jgi:hypothetical protein
VSAADQDDFVNDPTRGWSMARPLPFRRIHLPTCAVPMAYFADDRRCTCGLREAIDAGEFASHSDVEIPEGDA